MISPAKFALRIILFVLTICASWCGFWYYSHHKLQQAYIKYEKQQLADEAGFRCSAPKWGGFPFRHELRCDHFSLGSGDYNQIQFSGITFVAMAWDENHIITQFKSPMTIKGPTGALFEVGFDQASMSLRKEKTSLRKLDLVLSQITMKQTGLMSIPNALSAQKFELHARVAHQSSTDIDLFVSADNIAIGAEEAAAGESVVPSKWAEELLEPAHRPNNLQAPFAFANIKLSDAINNAELQSIKPVRNWLHSDLKLTINEALYAEQNQSYGVTGDLFFTQSQPPEGVATLNIANKAKLPPIFAPLMFFVKPQKANLAGFDNGIAYNFQVEDGKLGIASLTLFDIQAFLAQF